MSYSNKTLAFGLIVGALALSVATHATEPGTSAAVSSVDQSQEAGFISGSMVSGGLTRTFLLHLPNGKAPNRPVPLVIGLHGGGSNLLPRGGDAGRGFEKLTHFSKVADEHGFVVVFPNGIEKHWNDGRNLDKYKAQKEDVDDVRFLVELIKKLTTDYGVDPHRVYVTGMSNGGLMLHRLACESPRSFAAIAAVEGRIPESIAETCRAKLPMPLLIIQGSASPVFEKASRRFTGLETAQFWAMRNGCDAIPEKSQMPDVAPDDGLITYKRTYKNCAAQSDVVYLEVQGGGHAWPGGFQYLSEDIVGKTTRDFDASEEIWAFFSKFRR